MTDIATIASPARSIVFIDSRVQDAATLLQGLAPGTEVVFLQAGQDGLEQIAAALGERGDVGAVQVIAHGSAGQLWLGSRFLDNTTLQQPEVQALLASLGRGLTADGDLLLYACNTAQGSEGAQFVSTLAALTGADVAASDDRTGAGGDWELEISTGSIDHAAMLSAQGETAYQHGLATLTVTTGADSGLDANFGADQAADLADGAGLSLREALHWAQNGDTVTFNADMTVSLNTKAGADSLLILNKNLTIDGDLDNNGSADVTLDGQYKGRVLEVTTGTTAVLDGLVISNGLLSGAGGTGTSAGGGEGGRALGAGILNAGTLTFVNGSIDGNVATGGGGGAGGDGAGGGGGSGYGGIGGGSGGKGHYNDPGAPGGSGIGGGGHHNATGMWTAPSGAVGATYNGQPSGGNGGTGAGGGAGGRYEIPGYAGGAGGAGGTVQGAGGGGGGATYLKLGFGAPGDYPGGAGGIAAGGIHITSTGILYLANSTLSGNLGAGGGGGGGTIVPGAGGQGIGAIYNLGQLHYNAGTTTFTSNEGGGGTAGNGGATAAGTANLAGIAASSTTWTNDLPPALTGAAVPANGIYKAGQNLDFTVTYNEAVTVNMGGGTPTIALTLDTGGTVQAAYIAGTGTNTLTFRYTVATGNLDANGIAAATSISLNGGTIRDSGNNNAPTTGIPFASTTGVLVDAVAPSASSINRVSSATTNATSVDYTVTFSESVTGVDTNDFALTQMGTVTGTVAAVSGSGTTYTVTVNSISGDGALRLDLNNSGTGITDGAGNAIANGFTGGQLYTVDTTAPWAPSAPDLASASDSGTSGYDNITNTTTPTFTGTAEAGSTVRLYDSDGVTELGSAVATGGNWTITSTALAAGTHTITAKATDTAGNVSAASSALSVNIDTTAPTSLGLSATTATVVGATGGSTLATLSATDDSTVTYALAVGNGMNDADNGTFIIDGNSLKVGGASLSAGTYHIYLSATDVAGNKSYLAQSFTVQNVPVVTSIVRAGGASSVVTAGATSVDYTVTFSESITGVDATDFVLTPSGNASGSVSNITGSGTTYTVTVNDLSGDGTLRLDLKANGTGIQNGSSVAISGGYTSGATYTLDHTPPTTTIASIAFSADTGGSGADFITNSAAQTISGALSANLVAGETVQVSLDNGVTWAPAAATVGSNTFSLAGQTLTGSSTLQVRVVDTAGNNGSVHSQAYALDTTAPSLDSAASTPADNTTNVAVANNIVIAFSEALTATGSDLAKVYLRDVATDTLEPASISINSNGALVINPTGNLAYGTAYYVTWDADALRDTAGNSALAVSDKTSYNFTTQAAPSTPTVPGPVPVDGAQVTTQTGADGTITTTIAPVTSGRVDDPNTPNATLADVPLFQSGGNPLLLASLPVGFGLSASTSGISTAGNSLTDLIRQIQQHTAAGSQDQSQMTSAGTDFLGGLPSTTPLLVQTIVPTFQGSGTPGQALGISGQPATPGGPLTALVIDASGLPPSTSLQLNNVEFAAIIGAVSVSGGAGSQHVWGDSANQTILLGADDDILHGGGGNDTVGSLGGNDQVFGDDGDDIVFGGTGHDTLSGGTGNDHLDGGVGWDTALQSGSLSDYTLSQAGNALLLTHKTTGEVDHLKSVEMVKFDTGTSLYIADSDAEAAIAHIATKWLGRDLSAEEGAEFQAYSHLTALEVAQAVLRGPYGEQLQGHTAEELIAGWQDNPQILRMDVVSEVVQGSTGVDAINYGVKLADAHLQWVSDGVWEGTNVTNGDMAQLHSIERVHFSDASVALDGANLAALIAVTLGEASLQDRAITSEGLALMDSGWSNQAIGAAALQLAMGAGTHTAEDTVQWLWTKAYGSAGTAEQLQPYVQQLQSGATTVGDLAWEAAQYAQANPQVGLAGVQQQGLVYDAVVA